MIKILEKFDVVPVNIEFDEYIPINIEFGVWDNSVEPTIYWRTGDFENSLIEIGIGSKCGNIRSVTLTIVKNIHENTYEGSLNEASIIKGIPRVEINSYENKIYIDESKDFKVYIDDDKIRISFSSNEVISMMQNDRVLFGIDKNNLLSVIEINQLTQSEKLKVMMFN